MVSYGWNIHYNYICQRLFTFLWPCAHVNKCFFKLNKFLMIEIQWVEPKALSLCFLNVKKNQSYYYKVVCPLCQRELDSLGGRTLLPLPAFIPAKQQLWNQEWTFHILQSPHEESSHLINVLSVRLDYLDSCRCAI